jgi:hypothetical protein
MAYAVFPGDERYHVVKEGEDYTLCMLPALTPDEGEHHPRARVTEEPPPASLYRFCPQCLATLDSSKSDGPA